MLFILFVIVELTNIDATHTNTYKQDCREKRGCICGNERSGGSSDDEAQRKGGSHDKRGREIGFPTANMEVQDFMEIKFGVYAVKIEIEGYIYNGISNYGIRPTFDGEKLLLETYLFDFSKDIYGMDIVVSFVEFIRDEKRFDSVDELKKQIDLDIDKTIKILGS